MHGQLLEVRLAVDAPQPCEADDRVSSDEDVCGPAEVVEVRNPGRERADAVLGEECVSRLLDAGQRREVLGTGREHDVAHPANPATRHTLAA